MRTGGFGREREGTGGNGRVREGTGGYGRERGLGLSTRLCDDCARRCDWIARGSPTRAQPRANPIREGRRGRTGSAAAAGFETLVASAEGRFCNGKRTHAAARTHCTRTHTHTAAHTHARAREQTHAHTQTRTHARATPTALQACAQPVRFALNCAVKVRRDGGAHLSVGRRRPLGAGVCTEEGARRINAVETKKDAINRV